MKHMYQVKKLTILYEMKKLNSIINQWDQKLCRTADIDLNFELLRKKIKRPLLLRIISIIVN